ncbi:MAG: septum formation family protein [Nocardioidaceae bacterium]
MSTILGAAIPLASAILLASCGSAQDVADTAAATTDHEVPTQVTTQPTEATTESTATTAPSTPAATKTSDPTPQAASKPTPGECYATGTIAFNRQRDGSAPVSCNAQHTAETVAVFAAGQSPSSQDINNVWRSCQPRFKTYVGGAPTVSTLGLVVILPSEKQLAEGQSWMRCDAVERSSFNRDVGLPRQGSVKGALSGSVPVAYRGCVKHWPKVSLAVHFTSCRESHQAELIPESINLGGPNAPFPGTNSVKSKSKRFCANAFQDFVPETRNYYFYYPTPASWKSGSHDTTCWALDTKGNGLPPI